MPDELAGVRKEVNALPAGPAKAALMETLVRLMTAEAAARGG